MTQLSLKGYNPKDSWSQAEEMGATACLANILETSADATATPFKSRTELAVCIWLKAQTLIRNTGLTEAKPGAHTSLSAHWAAAIRLLASNQDSEWGASQTQEVFEMLSSTLLKRKTHRDVGGHFLYPTTTILQQPPPLLHPSFIHFHIPAALSSNTFPTWKAPFSPQNIPLPPVVLSTSCLSRYQSTVRKGWHRHRWVQWRDIHWSENQASGARRSKKMAGIPKDMAFKRKETNGTFDQKEKSLVPLCLPALISWCTSPLSNSVWSYRNKARSRKRRVILKILIKETCKPVFFVLL